MTEQQRFEDHLKLTQNHNIIFSGKFGIGKTYFLNDFFKNNTDYEYIRIAPVNYSIAQSEDIFKYINFDVIFELLEKGIDFERIDFKTENTIDAYLKGNNIEIIKKILSNFGRIGKPINDLIEIIEKYKEFNTKIQINDLGKLQEFLKKENEREGSIYEENFILELIRKYIETLEINKKETVLVIDDLDRLDPEHVFRIFNVFAAHLDLDENSLYQNKYGFSKIILVCDITNIRNIFSNRYGQNVDFSGYIDKFYSKEVFEFDNAQVLLDYINEKVGNKIESIIKHHDPSNKVGNPLDTKHITGIKYLFKQAVYLKVINFRYLKENLNKIKFSHYEKDYHINFKREIRIMEKNRFVMHLYILEKLLGHENFRILFLSLKDRNLDENEFKGDGTIIDHLKNLINSNLFLGAINIHKFKVNDKLDNKPYKFIFFDREIKFFLKEYYDFSDIQIVNINELDLSIFKEKIGELFYLSYVQYKNIGSKH
jgi:hypothetical protein